VSRMVLRFLDLVAAQEGAPYVWAGKGEFVAGKRHTFAGSDGQPCLVFDCSGLVTWSLRKCGWQSPRELNSHGMWMHWRRTDKPQPGDLIIYGQPGKASHVEVLMPDGRYFGAIGGNSKTLKPTPGAACQYRRKRRDDVLGHLTNPLRSDNDAA